MQWLVPLAITERSEVANICLPSVHSVDTI